MKVLGIAFALVALTSSFKILTKKAKLLTKTERCEDPDWYMCPSGGCCPDNLFCCLDEYPPCAATPAECDEKISLVEMAKNKIDQCGPDETSCPAGCCPEANWYCCPDAYYCAATAADCPYQRHTRNAQLVKLAKTKTSQCSLDETTCPSGCCPESNWVCCPGDATLPGCAPSLLECDFADKWVPLVKLANTKTKTMTMWGCDPASDPMCPDWCDIDNETPCYGGCCPHTGWYCCPDQGPDFCAEWPADCP